MGNINIEQSILQAIDIVLSDRIKNAGYNRTIQAIVIECTDPTIGQYRVQYQDSFLNAYSDNTDTSYTKGTSVYVLIPNGDMSQNKMIIGSVDKLGTDYVNAIKLENKYAAVGNNVLSLSSELFELSSFKTLVKVLYTAGTGENLIQVDNDAAAIYLNEADCIIIKAKIKNNLPVAQKSRGNFGIIYALDFKDNNTGEEITRYYILDVDQMEGNPYTLPNYTDQVSIFPVDGLDFVRINSISIFSKDFPNQDDSADNDIFIKDLSLVAANEIEESEINGYSLNLLTPQGYIFGAGTAKEINALLRVKGELATYTEGMEFYWFVLNVNITTQSLYYNSYAGQGWKCLNDYNIIQDAETDGSGTVTVPAVLQFIPASSTLEIKKSDLLTLRVKYKCVLVYNSNVLSKEITFVNLDADYSISIESSDGIEFFKDVGETTLTCKCKYQDTEVSSSDLIYSWCLVNSLGNFETIGSNSSINILARNIFDFSFYKCSVFAKNTGSLIGTAAIKITNSLEDNNRYHVIINNGTQVFKYNERGLSPASKQLDDPIDIPALTFTVYNQKGLEIDESILSNYDIVWKVPAKRTLLKIDGSQEGEMDENEEYIYYHNFMSLVYSIMDNYSIYNSNNDIELIINYNDMILTAKTDFTFLKEGLAGTNGTDFVCKIVPNVVTGYEVPENPTVYYDGSSLDFNWQNAGKLDGKWFKAELWHNGELIYSGTDKNGSSSEGKTVTISDWSILKNKYKYDLSDKSDFQVTKNLNAGTWSFAFSSLAMSVSSQISEWRPADIVKVTLKYDGLTYYATLPLIFCRVWQYNSYRVRLEDNTGFQRVLYSSSGLNPEYYNNNNFKVITEQKISNQWTDISLNSGINYKWYCNGIVKKQSGTSWISDVETENEYGQTSGKWLLNYSNNDSSMPINERKIRPADSYDGLCVTVGLSCLVKNGNSNIGWIHIPIHMSLNRFENANLNTWDGNSVNLGGDNGGMIIAPQVGAGVKDSNNRFTGMFIGTAKDPNQTASSITTIDAEHWKDGLDVGLFGYAAGARSIFLDAKTGKAEFGTQGAGQIILDPSSNQALIRSGNYDPNTNKTGMQINLSEPSINYGSGNFTVDQNGVLTAKSAILSGIQLSADSTYGGNTLAQILDTIELNYEAYVDGVAAGLQDQIDDNITSWYYNYDPTLNNIPAVDWDPTGSGPDSYAAHQGDIFFNRTTSRAFRFLKDGNVWKWAEIQDEDISKAIADAARAQDTADHKRRVFVAQPVAADTYDIGDLWVNATYGTTYNNDLLRCKTNKDAGVAFSISHWLKAAKYTDDSLLWAWVQGDYADDYKAQQDAKIETFYQSSDPSSGWTTTELKNVHTGDIWYCTNANDATYAQQSWRWNGTAWEKMKTAPPDAIMDTIDGKAQVFTGASAPVPPYDIGDLWFNSTQDNRGLIYTCVKARAKNETVATSDWKIRHKYTDDSAFAAFRDGTYATFVTNTGNALNGKITTFYQTSAPTAVVTGDLWIDTDDGNKLYRWNGSSWVNIQDTKIQQALTDAGTAQATADRKIVTYAQNDAPASSSTVTLDTGDLWIDTNDNNKMYRWNGSKWIACTDTSALNVWLTDTYADDKTTLQNQIDGKIETFSQILDPSTSWNATEKLKHVGDLWYNSTSTIQKYYRWTGSAWTEITATPPSEVTTIINNKANIFTGATRPTPPYKVGDLWFNAIADNTGDIKTCVTARTSGTGADSDWKVRNKYTDDSGLTNFVNSVYNPKITLIESEIAYIDGKVDTWFYSYEPTLSNAPASTWTTTDDKDAHTGDLFYNINTGYVYRFKKSGTTYSWERIKDKDITDAMSAASAAQDTADHKRRVFVAQPTPPYDVGDLWTQGSTGDIMRCKTARASGSYNANDWEKASKYTDDSTFTTFRDGTYATFVTNTGNALSGKITTFYQASAPTAVVTGDLWIDTDDGNKLYRWNGSSWTNIQDSKIQKALTDAGTAQATADRKIVTYAQNDAPTSTTSTPLDIGDLWIDTNDNNKMYRWSGSAWVAYTDTSALNFWLTDTYASDKNSLQTQIDGKVETWSQTSDPSTSWTTADLKNLHKGDLWYNTTSTVQKYYRWTGTQWAEITATPPTAVTNTINGKANIFVGTTTPSNPKAGDLWFKGDDQPILTYVNNQWKEYNEYVNQEDINSSISTFDTKLNQTKVFNKLTNNGTAQGIYMDSSIAANQLYINALYLKSGYILAARIAAGTITGSMLDASKLSTVGLSKFNNDVGFLTQHQDLSNYATKGQAIAQQLIIYISKASGTTSVTKPTAWVEDRTGGQNKWTTKIPDYSSNYPRIFYATQYKLVNGSYGCTDPIINDKVSYIDGGSIRTGKIDADRIVVDDLTALGAKIGNFTLENGYIHSGNTTSTSDGAVTISNQDFTRSINGSNKTELRLAIGGKFGVKKDGTIYATGADISGTINATSLTLGTSVAISQSNVNGLTTALGQKANTNDLSTVATSGNYSDLSGKPSKLSDFTDDIKTLRQGDVSITTLTNDGIVTTTSKYKDSSGTVQTFTTKTDANGKYVRLDKVQGNVSTIETTKTTGFTVSTEGLLQANNAIIRGKIFAALGDIAGWTINSKSLTNGTLGSSDSIHLLTADQSTGTDFAGAGSALKTWRLGIGAGFGVTKDGTLYATGANITGEIHATSLYIGTSTTAGIPMGYVNNLQDLLDDKASYEDIMGKNLLNNPYFDQIFVNAITTSSPAKNWSKLSSARLSYDESTDLLTISQSSSSSYYGISQAITVEPNTTYTISALVGATYQIAFGTSGTSSSGLISNWSTANDGRIYATVTTGSSTTYYIYLYSQGSSSPCIVNRVKVEKGDSYTGWYDKGVKNTDSGARYITYIDSTNGIHVHDGNNLTSYAQINSNGMQVYKSGNQVAQFSDTTTIGKISTAHTTIDSKSLMLSYNTNDPIFKIQGNSNYNITSINRTIRAGSDYCTIPTGLNSEMISVVQSETVELLNTTYITPVTFEYIPESGKLTIIGGNPLSSRDFIISYISNIDNIALIYGSLNTEVLGADPNDGYCGTNLGFNVNARGPFSTAIGKSSIAEGSYSFAVGDAVMSSGICSFAAGRNTKALGQYTHALGYRTTAGQSDGDSDKLGNYSHAEGYVSNTYGNYSHAEGYMTIAYGLASHTEGYNTSAIADYQTVVGKNNLLSQDGLFVVGNGTDWNNRSNAFEVKSNGNVYISGNAYMSNNLIATQAWVTAQRDVQINSNYTGKMRLGNCLIQWGYISDIGCANGATKAVTVNFPTAYNTYVPGVVCTPNMGNTSHLGGYCTLTVENLSTSGFTARWRNANTAAGTTFSIQAFWIAIGNITI